MVDVDAQCDGCCCMTVHIDIFFAALSPPARFFSFTLLLMSLSAEMPAVDEGTMAKPAEPATEQAVMDAVVDRKDSNGQFNKFVILCLFSFFRFWFGN